MLEPPPAIILLELLPDAAHELELILLPKPKQLLQPLHEAAGKRSYERSRSDKLLLGINAAEPITPTPASEPAAQEAEQMRVQRRLAAHEVLAGMAAEARQEQAAVREEKAAAQAAQVAAAEQEARAKEAQVALERSRRKKRRPRSLSGA